MEEEFFFFFLYMPRMCSPIFGMTIWFLLYMSCVLSVCCSFGTIDKFILFAYNKKRMMTIRLRNCLCCIKLMFSELDWSLN